MSSAPSLTGARVLVTRPAEQADPLCRLLEKHGASVTRLPLQVIEPTRQSTAAATQLQQSRAALAWIFTSANAVRFARSLDAGVWPPCIAVGAATAAALQQLASVTATVPPQRYDSEGVLALPELQDVRDHDVVIVTGEGGRDAIETGLTERGARVTRIEVYRRVALPHAPDRIEHALRDVDAIVVTNGEALQQLVARTPDEARAHLFGLQLVVPSQRVVEQALELGFTTAPLVPEQIGDAGYLRALEPWWRTRLRDPRMTDQDNKQDTPTPSPENAAEAAAPPPPPAPVVVPARKSSGAWWGLLWALVVLALVAAAGWEGWRRAEARFAAQQERLDQLQRNLDAATTQVDRIQTRFSDQAVAVQRNAGEIARFADRLDTQDAAVGELREELGGGRARVQLAVVEQLLMLASDRLQVGREVPAAIVALEAADARLATLGDPRLFAVREAIARDRAALQAVPRVDDTGAALALSSLIDRVPRLALRAQVPDHFEAEPATAEPAAVGESRWERAWTAVQRALASSFTIRREDGPPAQLLSDEQNALIRQVLALKLEGARVALLRRDAASFRELSRSAATWLDEYFNVQDPAIVAARAELTRLQGLQLDPALPDVSRSLVLLRAQLESASP